jgi:hypothetical protein
VAELELRASSHDAILLGVSKIIRLVDVLEAHRKAIEGFLRMLHPDAVKDQVH